MEYTSHIPALETLLSLRLLAGLPPSPAYWSLHIHDSPPAENLTWSVSTWAAKGSCSSLARKHLMCCFLENYFSASTKRPFFILFLHGIAPVGPPMDHSPHLDGPLVHVWTPLRSCFHLHLLNSFHPCFTWFWLHLLCANHWGTAVFFGYVVILQPCEEGIITPILPKR